MSAKALRTSEGEAAAVQSKQLGMKRLIFLSSLYFKLRGIKNPTIEQLNSLNKRFNLAHREGTLRLPAAMSCILWGKTDADNAFCAYLQDERQLSQVDRLVAMCPEWARYDSLATLARDAKAVFCYAKAQH